MYLLPLLCIEEKIYLYRMRTGRVLRDSGISGYGGAQDHDHDRPSYI